MPLNPLFTVSITACVLGTLFAGLAWFMAKAPGLSQLRPFALSSVSGAAYAACNAALLSPITPEAGVWMSRVSTLVAGCHGASWFFYRAKREGRSLTRLEEGLVTIGLAFGALSLVPGAIYGGPREHVVPWAGAVYRDALATPLGDACFAFYACSLLVPLSRSARALVAGDRSEVADVVGMSALLVTGVHDSLVAARVIPMPYLLDVGYLVLVTSVAVSLAARFRATTIDLHATKAELVARERLAALGEMSAVVAHEVRNPVGVIFNAVAMLRRVSPTDPKREELLAMVEEEAERLKRMIANLLDFAKPPNVTLTEVDVTKLLTNVATSARLAGGVEGANPIERDHPRDEVVVVPPAKPVHVACDPELMRQALLNLVQNALQAEGRARAVELRAREDRESVVIEVVDDGDGVAEQDRERIFLPFFTTRPTGVGLGLPVVSRVVEAHGGELAYRTTDGGGATFGIRLPRRGARRRS
jgi:signal transduction histidine kinase